jgi:hypothetical protein
MPITHERRETYTLPPQGRRAAADTGDCMSEIDPNRISIADVLVIAAVVLLFLAAGQILGGLIR